jgi:hypothetical protein
MGRTIAFEIARETALLDAMLDQGKVDLSGACSGRSGPPKGSSDLRGHRDCRGTEMTAVEGLRSLSRGHEIPANHTASSV